MQVEITEHALDRVPISLIIDDSAPLVNLNYFFLRDRIAHTGKMQRWEDVPVAIPEFFAREFGEWCAENGVKGKFSVIPCPAALGCIDEGLPLFGKEQIESWLRMCREVIAPSFDITPEMLTHTFVLDLKTLKPVEPRIWEQYEWERLEDYQLTVEYIRLACKILDNVGLPPTGVTSPGGFGGRSLDLYAKATGAAVSDVTGKKTPFFFKRIQNAPKVDVPVWYADREAGTAVGEIIACTGDWTGSWTGYEKVNPDYYITADLKSGRLPEVIDAGGPCVLCSHWQGFYGMHNGDRRGFKTLQTVVKRLRERDPDAEYTRWCKVSEITDYACARELARITVADGSIELDLPLLVPDLTLILRGIHPAGIRVDDMPLKKVTRRRDFASGSYYEDGDRLLVAFTPGQRRTVIELTS